MTSKKTRLISILGCLCLFLFWGALFSKVASAADYINFQPQIGIPGSEFDSTGKIMVNRDTSYIATYVKAFYNYGLGIAGILAAIVLMGGGVIWLTSGGSESRVGQAKELIFGSITGLAILVGAWVLLNTINPDLVNFKPSSVLPIEEIANNAISCDTTMSSSTCNTIAFCIWKDNKCVGKVEAGAAKCSTNKAEVPGPLKCCCQSNPSGYVNCKWATYMGEAWLDSGNPQGAPTAGPCAACGSTEYGVVSSGSEYLCQKAYDDEQAALTNTSTAFSLSGCENKVEESSCTKIIDLPNGSSATIEGFCLNKTCEACFQPGTACGNIWNNNFKCVNKAGATGQCGTEHHGNCKLKLNQANICEVSE